MKKKALKKSKAKKIHFHILYRVTFAIIGIVLLSLGIIASANNNGFDQFGYNRTARIFEGKADGVDRNLDGTFWGNTTYANDHLKMKWNAEWDRGNAESWSNPPYGAWLDNNWNGKKPGGSGEVWQYRIVWNGPCGADGALLPKGGYCIWGQFAVILSHGTSLNQHFWDAHAVPTGFGSY